MTAVRKVAANLQGPLKMKRVVNDKNEEEEGRITMVVHNQRRSTNDSGAPTTMAEHKG